MASFRAGRGTVGEGSWVGGVVRVPPLGRRERPDPFREVLLVREEPGAEGLEIGSGRISLTAVMVGPVQLRASSRAMTSSRSAGAQISAASMPASRATRRILSPSR